MALREITEVLEEHTGLARKVLEYSLVTKRLVDAAKQPGFSTESWAPLAELVAVAEFSRVGPFKEEMDWKEYVDFLTAWATSSEWECSFKRITESHGLVFLELEERSKVGDYSNVVNSVSVYEFDDEGGIRHIDVYLQMALPEGDMLKAYDDVQISE